MASIADLRTAIRDTVPPLIVIDAAVARLRADLGLDPSPASDAIQVADRRLCDAAAAGEWSSPPTDPPGGAGAD